MEEGKREFQDLLAVQQMCSDAGVISELRCRCWCNSAAVRQGYGSELRVGVVVEGRAASRAAIVAAIAPVAAGRYEYGCVFLCSDAAEGSSAKQENGLCWMVELRSHLLVDVYPFRLFKG
ncbi:hypothetical protein F0562_006011 [Nyssa sinensis]|uniref:Uncharacterized protein n=1 Tax=Nyssa sinensis TaxID=561372 RepID=A0A5J5ANE6_9ASTE|nr:hypothetical protein F0562_006011 [Nyssa sinensis]